LLLARLSAPAQDFQDLQKKITAFTLPNGIRFVVVERHDAPTIAARTYIRAGSVNDPAGRAGLAHLFEHLVLVGTEGIGARDATAEKKALDALEDVRDRIDAERNKGARADEVKIASLGVELSRAAAQARTLGNPAELVETLQGAGIQFTSSVSADATILEATVPSNRAELWFLTEAQRLSRPVFRNFYVERDQELETYRSRVDNAPGAVILNMLTETAFSAQPYRNRVFGWPSDLSALRMADAREFFNRNWVPGNIVVSLAGDLTGEEARRLADKYFGAIPARPLPAPVHTLDPEQKGPRVAVLENSPQALLAVGYKRPDEFDRDDVPLEIVRTILGAGHTGWLNQALLDEKRVATTVQVQSTYPGGLYPHLFVVVATAAPGHTAAEVEKEVTAVIVRLQSERVDPATLERARTLARGALIRRLVDNAGIAATLGRITGEFGDYHRLFSLLDDLGKVTADQVQTAALKYLTPARRTSVYAETPAPVRGGAR
jgi:predicted Zn-dependent peptidase